MSIFSTSSSAANIDIDKDGTKIGTRPALNFITGSNTSLTVTDNSTDNRVDVTIAAQIGEVDGGFANSVYLLTQNIDGGNASSF